MKLREYQIEAVGDLFTALDSNETANPLVALPTGTGKSLCIAATVKRTMMEKPGARIIKATHSQQLVTQNEATLKRFMPMLRTGVYCAGVKRKETQYPVTYGSIQSMVNVADQFGRIDAMIVDEAHLIPQKGAGMYRKFIKALRKTNPELRVIGYTATPYRLGLGSLLNADIFNTMAHDATSPDSFRKFIADGWLCPLIAKSTSYKLDTDGVAMRGGEFVASSLATHVDDHGKTIMALTEACDISATSRHKWLVFTASIDHSEHVTEILNAMGVPAVALHSKTVEARSSVLDSFTAGNIQALVSCDMMTTGFDYPPADCIVMLRPTMSTGLWVQMLGRGTRPFHGDHALPAKENCLVLDFAGNTMRLGPIDDPVLPKAKGAGGGTAPVKACEVCDTYNHTSARECFVCGWEFPRRPLLVFDTADATSPMSAAAKLLENTATWDVRNMTYQRHKKAGKPDSLKVTYWCGLTPVTEWVCFEHPGKQFHKAQQWWVKHGGDQPAPVTVAEALDRVKEIHQPEAVVVVTVGKWINVNDHIFKQPIGAAHG